MDGRKAINDLCCRAGLQADIQLEIDVPSDIINTKKPWLYGTVRTWKSLASLGTKTFRVKQFFDQHHRHIEPATCDTSMFEKVLRTLKYDCETEKWSAPTDQVWPTSEQRSIQRAFIDGFSNSSGRNFVDCLLHKYIRDEEADIMNVGGGALPNNQMHTLKLIYFEEYTSPSEQSSSQSTPEKSEIVHHLDMSFEDSSCSSSENISYYHTPVVDNMVYIENQKRAILIVSVKKNRFIQYDYEQLRHEMLSMLPVDEGVMGHVGGMLICRYGAVFMVASKYSSRINITSLKEFDFEDENDICLKFSSLVGYIINFYNYCKEPVIDQKSLLPL